MVIPVGPPGRQHILKVSSRPAGRGQAAVKRSDIYNRGRCRSSPSPSCKAITIKGAH